MQRWFEGSALRNYFLQSKTLAPDFQPKGTPTREELLAVLLHQPAKSQRLLKGKRRETKGKLKEKAGQLANNPGWEVGGTVEKADGKVQGASAKMKKAREK